MSTTIKSNTDGSSAIQTGGVDRIQITTSGDVVIPGSLVVGTSSVQKMVFFTPQSTTSGTFVDFTSFPSWVRRVTVSLNGVSTNGTSGLKLQLYASGVLTTSGYACETSYVSNSGTNVAQTTDRIFDMGSSAPVQAFGNITLLNPSGNSWISSGIVARFGEAVLANQVAAGGVTLSSILTGLRLSSANGTDTFDGGSVNILVEGY